MRTARQPAIVLIDRLGFVTYRDAQVMAKVTKRKRTKDTRARVGKNVSFESQAQLDHYIRCSERASGGLDFSQFVRIALDEKIARDGLDKAKG